MANINELTPEQRLAGAQAEEQKAKELAMQSPHERKLMLAQQIRALEALEARDKIGARVLTPKQAMMDTAELEAANPDLHYRWGNLRNADKMEQRKAEGYTRVSEAEGGRNLGDEMVLLSIPRRVSDARNAAFENKTRVQLDSFKQDVSMAAESVAREMRDRHGIKVDAKDIFVNER